MHDIFVKIVLKYDIYRGSTHDITGGRGHVSKFLTLLSILKFDKSIQSNWFYYQEYIEVSKSIKLYDFPWLDRSPHASELSLVELDQKMVIFLMTNMRLI